MFKLRVFNFSYFSLFAIFLSFLPVYLSNLGLPETEIGLMIGTGGFIGLFSQPFWGVVSDRRKSITRILLLTLAVSTVIGFVLFRAASPWALVLLVGLMYFFFMPTDSLVESLNFQSAVRRKVNYGSIKMFGALGYATASFAIGYLTDWTGPAGFAWVFLGYGIATWLIGFAQEDVEASAKPLKLAELKAFLGQKSTVSFLLLIFLLALPHRTNDTYIGIYIREMGGSFSMVGTTWFVMTMVEFLCFAVVHRFLKRGNELKLIAWAGVFYVLRFGLTAVADQAGMIVVLQLLQGVTFVFFYSAAMQHLYAIVPEAWRATGQTILAIVFFGVSGIVASFAGGLIFEHWGGRVLYGIMTGLSLIGCLYSVRLMRRKRRGDTVTANS
ncbi:MULTISPECIES: MFS transporter [Paenibacillus]|uniref:MFS transporter n=1 Tax=Paenibacillus TaxID=44249 RepID=UPI00073EE100|nr:MULTISPECIES: MFS transporter [Paenibacillus]MDU4695828.1 MFS transporter [Paenibacillus sp.]